MEAGSRFNARAAPDGSRLARSAPVALKLSAHAGAVMAKLGDVAPYALIELILPGGSVMALLLLLYRQQKKAPVFATHEILSLLQLFDKIDAAALRFRRMHEFTDGRKNRSNNVVVFDELFVEARFELRKLTGRGTHVEAMARADKPTGNYRRGLDSSNVALLSQFVTSKSAGVARKKGLKRAQLASEPGAPVHAAVRSVANVPRGRRI